MIDLEEDNDHLKSKVILLKSQVTKLKSDIKASKNPEEGADKSRVSCGPKSVTIPANDAPNDKDNTEQRAQSSDSHDIVYSSQNPALSKTLVAEGTRRAVTRRASSIAVSCTKVSPQAKRRRSQRSLITHVDENDTLIATTSNTRTRRSLLHTSGSRDLQSEGSASQSSDDKRRKSSVTVIPETQECSENIPTEVQQGEGLQFSLICIIQITCVIIMVVQV